VPKSGQVTITKTENLHTPHVAKFTDSKNAILFDLRRKVTKLTAEKPFQNIGVTMRLAVLN